MIVNLEIIGKDNKRLSLSLSLLDVGFLLGFVTEGYLIKYYGFEKTLICIAATAAAGILYYAWRQRPGSGRDACESADHNPQGVL